MVYLPAERQPPAIRLGWPMDTSARDALAYVGILDSAQTAKEWRGDSR